MNKLAYLVIAISLLSIYTVYAADIAYVLKNPSNPDDSFTQAIDDLGLSYDLIDSDDVASLNLDDYRALLVGDERFSNPEDFPVGQHPILLVNSWHVDDDWFLSNGIIQIVSNQKLKVKNVDLLHPITENLDEIVEVYSVSSTDLYYLSGAKASGINLISKPNGHSDGDMVIATLEAGDVLCTWPGCSPEIDVDNRIAFFGITETDAWTNDAEQLFKNTINWVLLGADIDEDGFYSDDDCNDLDPDINPDANEVAYDGIDQDCDGLDLTDVDLDGFDSTIVDGNDCNDDDSSINPDATEIIDDIDQNCVNDAPIKLGNIPNQIWSEDNDRNNVFDLDNYFADYENDDLSYTVSGNSEINVDIGVDNLVSLSQPQDWFGIENVIFTANDGQLTDSNEVELKVNNVNDDPTIDSIADQTIVETYLLDISSLVNVNDVDSTELTIIYNNPLDSNGQWQTDYDDNGQYIVTVRVEDDNDGFAETQVNINVIPKILINEFEANPEGTDSGKEWIELYNNNEDDIDLTDWYVKDLADNKINVAGTILGFDYLIIDINGAVLNNGGDTITLYNNNDVVIDTASGTDSGNDENTIARKPDGFDSDSNDDFLSQKATKGISNDADLISPIVTLVSPEDNAFFDVDEVLFTYHVSDNEAEILACTFYSDADGTWEPLANEIVTNDEDESLRLYDLEDGSYIWNVECVDGLNSAFAAEDYHFTIDVNDAPVLDFIDDITVTETDLVTINPTATDNENDDLTFSFSNPLDNNGQWQTDYDDAGQYIVTVEVSDGSLTDSQDVTITVNDLNRNPELITNVPDQNLDEDGFVEINLLDYFVDPDTDNVLSFTNNDLTNLVIQINDNIAKIIPNADWFGTEVVMFTANDGQLSIDSNEFNVNVNPVNDLPTYLTIPNQEWNEDQDNLNAFDLDDFFSDIDDSLSYTVLGNSNIDVNIDADNIVSFSQPQDWFGTEIVKFTANDGQSSIDSNEVELKVNDINDAPVFSNIEDQNLDEDFGIFESINLDNYVSDVDDNDFDYSVKTEDEINCIIDENLLSFESDDDWFGQTSCTIEVSDGDLEDTTIVNINVNNVNDAPTIEVNPNYNPNIAENSQIEFSITKSDVDNDNLDVSWYVDNELVENEDSYVFNSDDTIKTYDLRVEVSDSELTTDYDWLITVSDVPIANNFNGDTTDFSNLDLGEVDLVLELQPFGKIVFNLPLNLQDTVDFDNHVVITDNYVSVNSDYLTALSNIPATITLYDVEINDVPVIYYDQGFSVDSNGVNTICPGSICSNINYENNVLTFDVTGFSSFMAGDESLTCKQQSGFICKENQLCNGDWLDAVDSNQCCSVRCEFELEDLDVCKDGVIGNIDVKIKEPDDGDDFNPHESIEVEIEVENDESKDIDITVKAVLFNLDEEEEEVDEESDEEEIEEDDELDFLLTLDLPSDLDAKDDYLLFVKAFEDRNEDEFCAEDSIEIDIKRLKHDIVISDKILSPSIVTAGNLVNLEVDLENIGSSDEDDVLVRLTSPELKLNQRLPLFNLNDGKDITKNFLFEVPENAKSKTYHLNIEVDFNGKLVTDSVALKVKAKPVEKPVEKVIVKQLTTTTIEAKKPEIKEEPFFSLSSDDVGIAAFIGLNIAAFIAILYLVTVLVRRF